MMYIGHSWLVPTSRVCGRVASANFVMGDSIIPPAIAILPVMARHFQPGPVHHHTLKTSQGLRVPGRRGSRWEAGGRQPPGERWWGVPLQPVCLHGRMRFVAGLPTLRTTLVWQHMGGVTFYHDS